MIVVQITDLHIGYAPTVAGVPIDTGARLDLAVEHINRLGAAVDAVIVTGDLTTEGSRSEYARVRASLSRLTPPCYLIAGNHDERSNLRAVFADHAYLHADRTFLHYSIEEHPLRLVGLDTHVPGEEGGELCEGRLRWLREVLAAEPRRPTLLFLHHPPFRSGIPSFDATACRGAEELGAIVRAHEQVQGIACGHIHRAMHVRWCGTVVTVCPSAAFQYPLALDGEHVDPVAEPPACMLHMWTPGVGLVSHLSYIPQRAL
jgi:3',5'-cyclic AMP phosphodiesterase CpdA